MPEDTDVQTDEQATDQQEQSSGGVVAKAKTYSKAELDAIVNKATVKAKHEFSDYLDLKQKAEEYDRLQESSKSNEDKLRERADKMTRERDAALSRAQSTLVRSAIISAASRLGSVDPEAVAALLSRDDLVIEGDEVIGVEDAVKALLAKKPYLRPGANRAGAEMQGGGSEPTVITRSQIREWARSGGLTAERQKQITEAHAAGKVLDR